MSYHEKIVSEIEKKMAGPSMLKSEQEKKQQIFEYDHYESQFNNLEEYHRPPITKNDLLIPHTQVQKNLTEIYYFYVNTYIQPRKHYETFDQVNDRKLTFQPFILFMKQFKLLKTIFPPQKIKQFFNKYSNYGRYLTLDNFIFLINELSHQPQAKQYFGIPANVDLQTQDELQKQEFYNYMHLHDPKKYRQHFKGVFQPFYCKEKPAFGVKKFTYRKFSLPELRKKAIPSIKDQPNLYVVKDKDQFYGNPFEKAKSIIVSWETLKEEPKNGVHESSAQVVHRKYIARYDPEDDMFMGEFKQKQSDLRKNIETKLKQMQNEEGRKNRLILSKLRQNEEKIKLKTSQSKKNLQKLPNWK